METSSLSTASTCGIPLPFAEGANRRTSQAATPAAAAAAATTAAAPSGPWPCAQPTITLRS